MRPILIDTNAYSAFKLNQIEIIEVIREASTLIMSPIVLGELLMGFMGGKREQQNRVELQNFLASSRIKQYPITADTSHYFGRIHNLLKKKGRPIPTNDIWIAAQALEYGCVICTFDKHFLEIEGLIVGHSISELIIG